MATPPGDIQHAPAPWKLKATVYNFVFWTKPNEAGNLPPIAYSPLEYTSSYASSESGRPVGGLSMMQLIRYTESPVGPYDELIVAPGSHEYTVEENGKRIKKKNIRITRIYVSQKYTCWNGRHNWNIPKHLAKFEWDSDSSGQVSVKVFPHDTTDDATEASASTAPFFQTKFKPVSWLPSFPLSLNIVKYLGQDLTLVHPPLPAGAGSQGELPGTERWCAVAPGQSSRKVSFGWFDMKQDNPGEDPASPSENFWPGLGRWQLGLVMEGCEVDFPEGKYWDSPKTTL